MIKSITLLGSSSGKNAGDAALISGIMDTIDEACGSRLLYEIPTFRPDYIWYNYTNRVRPVSMLPWHASVGMAGIPTFNSLARTDLSLIFDAILFDRKLYNPLFNYLSTLSVLLPYMKSRGKLLGCFNVGTGPVSTDAGKKMLRELSNAMDFITVRADEDAELLRNIGVTNPKIVVTADAAVNMPPAPRERVDQIFSEIGLNPNQEILAFNVNRYLDTWVSPDRKSMGADKFVDVYSKAVNRIIDALGVPVLFVCTQHHDVELTEAIKAKVKTSVPVKIVTNKTYNHYDMKGVLGRVALLYGMRLHSIILASSALTPVSALLFQPKVKYYLKTLGLDQYAMSFDDFNEEFIARHVINAWEKRKEIRATLERSMPITQNSAKGAARIVAALHRGASIDDAVKAAAGNSSATLRAVGTSK